jgi:hypothetical protein
VSRSRIIVLALVAITVVAGLLRFDAASTPSNRQSVDERAYGRLARYLARDGRYWSPSMKDPTRWPPGAPFVFAAAHELRPRFTRERRWDVPSAYPVQAAAGTLLIPAVFALTALLAGPVAGLLAALLVALYPPLIRASGDLLTEPLGALAIAAALIAVLLALRRPGPWRGLAAGALLGIAVLVRADLLLLPFALAVVVALVTRTRRGVATGALIAAGFVLAVAPWSVYASRVADRFVPVSSGGASNLFVGTYLPGDGSMFGLKRAYGFRYDTPQVQVIDRVAAQYPGLSREAALEQAARDNIDRYVLGDPVGFAGLALRKIDRLWLGYTVGTYRNQQPEIRAYHLLLVAIGALGLVAAAVRRGPAGMWILATVLAYLTAVNVVLVSEARHNLPVMPVVVAAGVAGLATLRHRAQRGDRPHLRDRVRARLRHPGGGQPAAGPGPA